MNTVPDLYLDRKIEKKHLLDSLANSFKLACSDIIVCLYKELPFLKDSDQIKLTCVINEIEGDFFFYLRIYSDLKFSGFEILEMIGNFCKINNCQSLIVNDYFDIYKEGMILIKGIDKYTGVLIDEAEQFGPATCIVEKWTPKDLTYNQLTAECNRLYKNFYG